MEMLESSLAWLQPLKFQHYDQNITGHMRFGRSSRSANCASQTCCPRAFPSPCQWEVYCLFVSFACTIHPSTPRPPSLRKFFQSQLILKNILADSNELHSRGPKFTADIEGP